MAIVEEMLNEEWLKKFFGECTIFPDFIKNFKGEDRRFAREELTKKFLELNQNFALKRDVKEIKNSAKKAPEMTIFNAKNQISDLKRLSQSKIAGWSIWYPVFDKLNDQLFQTMIVDFKDLSEGKIPLDIDFLDLDYKRFSIFEGDEVSFLPEEIEEFVNTFGSFFETLEVQFNEIQKVKNIRHQKRISLLERELSAAIEDEFPFEKGSYLEITSLGRIHTRVQIIGVGENYKAKLLTMTGSINYIEDNIPLIAADIKAAIRMSSRDWRFDQDGLIFAFIKENSKEKKGQENGNQENNNKTI